MFSGKIIGRIVCTRKDESLEGTKLLLVQPITWEGELKGDPLVAIDSVGSGANEFIFYVKAREAAVADPRVPPVDAAIVGIIDGVEVKIRE
ncbi:MAG: EutN/CcmL family microcompartment protein [Firmicutes bacterium]|nr:EutN/CcmL family microcompartment protein [Bacillota bacterium]